MLVATTSPKLSAKPRASLARLSQSTRFQLNTPERAEVPQSNASNEQIPPNVFGSPGIIVYDYFREVRDGNEKLQSC